jgi:hypothetical protein
MRSTDLTNARPTGITAEQPAPQKPGTLRLLLSPWIVGVMLLLAALLIAVWLNVFDALFPPQAEREATDDAPPPQTQREVTDDAPPPQTQREVTDAVVEALRAEGRDDDADEAATRGFAWDAETKWWNCHGRGVNVGYYPAHRMVSVQIFYPAGWTRYTGTLTRTKTGKWVAPLRVRDEVRYLHPKED